MKAIFQILILLLVLNSCKSPRYLQTPESFKTNTRGLVLEYKMSKDSLILAEIIEVTDNQISLLPINKPGKIITLDKSSIKKADIIISLISDDPQKYPLLGGIAVATTAGHGYFMVFSFPLSLATTIIFAQDAAKGTYRMKYPEEVEWMQLYKFARFPQGIPDAVDKKLIK